MRRGGRRLSVEESDKSIREKAPRHHPGTAFARNRAFEGKRTSRFATLPAHAPARHPHDLIAVQPPIGAHGAEIRLRLQEIVDCPHETGETGIVRAVDKVRDGDQYNRHWNTHR
jgi:hypothetical protein